MTIEPLYDNRVIEQAIAAIDGAATNEQNIAVFESVRLAMNNYGKIMMPIVLTDEAINRLDNSGNATDSPSSLNGMLLDPEHDFTLRTIRQEADNTDWLVGFTSEAEYDKGPDSAIYNVALLEILPRIAGIEQVAGLVLNPWGNPFALRREMIQQILEINHPENQIFFNLGDITTLECDAIVNAANERLAGGGGVDGAIHLAAGRQLNKACKELGGCKTGEAKITKGFNLKARYIIHTVGPIYQGNEEAASYLAECYLNSLDLARAHNIHSIAFPAISAGAYGYPKDEAAHIAIDIAAQWLELYPNYGMQVIFCCFDEEMMEIYQRALEDLRGTANEAESQSEEQNEES